MSHLNATTNDDNEDHLAIYWLFVSLLFHYSILGYTFYVTFTPDTKKSSCKACYHKVLQRLDRPFLPFNIIVNLTKTEPTYEVHDMGTTQTTQNVAQDRAFISIYYVEYNGDSCENLRCSSVTELISQCSRSTVSANKMKWIDMVGIHDEAIITKLRDHFNIHSLIQKDISRTEQHGKFYVSEVDARAELFFSCQLIYRDPQRKKLFSEQISFYLQRNLLISFQEAQTGLFDTITECLEKPTDKIRTSEIHYLFYSLLSTIVKEHEDVLENLKMEATLTASNSFRNVLTGTVKQMYNLKRSIICLQDIISDLEQTVVGLLDVTGRLEMPNETNLYFKHLYNRVLQLKRSINTSRETLACFAEAHSIYVNELVKKFATISIVFVPLTFLCGIYGMNFEYMPELKMEYAYPTFLVSILVTGGLVIAMVFKSCHRRGRIIMLIPPIIFLLFLLQYMHLAKHRLNPKRS